MKKIHILRLALLAGLTATGITAFALAGTVVGTGPSAPYPTPRGQNLSVGTVDLSNGANGQSVSIGGPGVLQTAGDVPGYGPTDRTFINQAPPPAPQGMSGVHLNNGSNQSIDIGSGNLGYGGGGIFLENGGSPDKTAM